MLMTHKIPAMRCRVVAESGMMSSNHTLFDVPLNFGGITQPTGDAAKIIPGIFALRRRHKKNCRELLCRFL